MARQHAQLAFGDVEPTAVLGRMMNLEALDQTPGFLRRKDFVEGCDRMGVEIVADQGVNVG